MKKNSIVLYFLFFSLIALSQKTYQKNCYKNGTIKEEGWSNNGLRQGYWYFYYPTGNIKEKGHYKNNIKEQFWQFYYENSTKKQEGHYDSNGLKKKWWVFYNTQGNINYKCQFQDNLKNGYCLQYKDGNITKASKFANNIKLKEWNDFSSFKKENNLNDLK